MKRLRLTQFVFMWFPFWYFVLLLLLIQCKTLGVEYCVITKYEFYRFPHVAECERSKETKTFSLMFAVLRLPQYSSQSTLHHAVISFYTYTSIHLKQFCHQSSRDGAHPIHLLRDKRFAHYLSFQNDVCCCNLTRCLSLFYVFAVILSKQINDEITKCQNL